MHPLSSTVRHALELKHSPGTTAKTEILAFPLFPFVTD
jgi:hypothetical protein